MLYKRYKVKFGQHSELFIGSRELMYRNMPIKGAPPNKGAPYGLADLLQTTLTKIGPISLLIVRFSI